MCVCWQRNGLAYLPPFYIQSNAGVGSRKVWWLGLYLKSGPQSRSKECAKCRTPNVGHEAKARKATALHIGQKANSWPDNWSDQGGGAAKEAAADGTAGRLKGGSACVCHDGGLQKFVLVVRMKFMEAEGYG